MLKILEIPCLKITTEYLSMPKLINCPLNWFFWLDHSIYDRIQYFVFFKTFAFSIFGILPHLFTFGILPNQPKIELRKI